MKDIKATCRVSPFIGNVQNGQTTETENGLVASGCREGGMGDDSRWVRCFFLDDDCSKTAGGSWVHKSIYN